MPPQRRRGPYKRYLQDPNVPVPATTVWRRTREQAGLPHQGNDHIEDMPIERGPPENSQLLRQAEADTDTGLVSDADSVSDAASVMLENDAAASNQSIVGSESEEGTSSDSNIHGNDEINLFESESSSMDVSSIDGTEDELEESDIEGENENQVPEEDHEENAGHLLYQGSRITKKESDVLIMSFIIRWGLEENSIEHLLRLIDCHLPCSVLGSQYLFVKQFPVPDKPKIHVTCSYCFEIVPEVLIDNICESCGRTLNNRDSLIDEGNYFVQLSVSEQIENILRNNSLRSLLRNECEDNDVISGKVYKRYREEGVIGDDDLTLQWNTDSVSPFKSAKMQVWPIQACINELPYHARRENMIMSGLYFGKTKPNINAFLTPFVDELQSLHLNGIQVRIPGENFDKTVKVHTLLCSVDSVARPPLQGIMQYNGRFGCSFCLCRGTLITRGRGRARVYLEGKGQPRTTTQHLRALTYLEEYNLHYDRKKTHIQGVKARSILLNLSCFNIVSSFVPDYLHSVLEGVVKTFLKHWTDSNYRKSAWYLDNRKRKILSERLVSILPPVEITRKPRGLDEVRLLKASEFRHFLLYYSVACLKGLLPSRFLNHWFLLVYGMSVYLREKFTDDEATRAAAALNRFVGSIFVLYPNCLHLYTFNVHLLLHIPRAVERFGGLWASSTFPYEHFNGMVARLLSGTRSRPEQVCRSFLRLRQISHLGHRLFSFPNHSEDAKKLFDSIMSKYRYSQFSYLFSEHIRLFGASENYELTLVEKVAIQQCLNVENINRISHAYRRMIFRGTVYHASIYEVLKVRDNSTVITNDGQILRIARILVVKEPLHQTEICVVLGEELQALGENLAHDFHLNISSSGLMSVCHKVRDRIICRKPVDLYKKCVSIPYGNAVCIVPLVNTLERD